MNFWEKNKIGVFGSAGGSEMDSCKESARVIGREVAHANGIICTGACPGLPHEAALGANENDGIVLGFSPGLNMNDHINNHKFSATPYILTFTGMEKKGRNLICTRTCDAGIFISGRWGTMNEFTLMCDEGDDKVIGLLAGSGGFVDGKIIPALNETEKQSKAVIVINDDPIALVKEIFQHLTEIKRL
ncbi:MAG: hypothetical protein U9M94_02790 [Patescibacteria group bacterium]|nr:hypothetical protein [Patescibacteria group bacterium]